MSLFKNIIYAHEHTTIDLSGIKQDMDCCLDNKTDIIEEFGKLAQLGVSRIIDQTNNGMGRNPNYVREVSEAVGITIAQSTGYYKEPFLPEECYRMDEKQLSSKMVSELTNGIEQSGIKAEFIGEIGTGKDCIQPVEEKIFCAASRAHSETGASICTHTTLGTLGIEQIGIFQKYGVDLQKVVLSHIDLSGDLNYMLRLLDKGVNIAFDTVGKNNYQPDEKRVEWLLELCRRGFSPQIVLSVDITRKSHYKKNGGIGYAYLLESFVPALLDAGCPRQNVENMLVHTPARIYNNPERDVL